MGNKKLYINMHKVEMQQQTNYNCQHIDKNNIFGFCVSSTTSYENNIIKISWLKKKKILSKAVYHYFVYTNLLILKKNSYSETILVDTFGELKFVRN